MKKIIVLVTLSIVLCSASSFGQGKGVDDLKRLGDRQRTEQQKKSADAAYTERLSKLKTSEDATKESARQLEAARTAANTAKANIVSAESSITEAESYVRESERKAREASRAQREAGKAVKANIATQVKSGEYINCEGVGICEYNWSVKNLKDMEEILKRARKDLDNAENSAEEAEAAYRRAKAAEREAQKKYGKDSKELKKLEDQIAEYERRAQRAADRSDIRDDLTDFHRKYGKVERAYWEMYSKFDQQKLAAYLRQKLYETLNSSAFCEAKANCEKNPRGQISPDKMNEIFPYTPGSALRPPNSSSAAPVGSTN
jgi:chromosome segregation ATPase